MIDDVITSCGCTSVVYSREPVQPGKSLDLAVTYKADHPEHFNKTITVYCNVPDSPLQLKITGDAQWFREDKMIGIRLFQMIS